MSETALLLTQAAGRLLDRQAAAPEALSAAIQEAGLLSIFDSIDDAIWSSAAELAHLWGERAAPYPLVERLLGARLAGMAGLDVRAAAASGVAALRRDGRTVTLHGSVCTSVAPDTDHILFIAVDDRFSPWLARVPADSDGLVRTVDLAGFDRRGIPAAGLAVPADRAEPWAHHDRSTFLNEGTLLTSAAMVGAMRYILHLTIGYANIRVQFGRPIGKFQAVQTLISRLAGEVAAASAAVGSAVEAFDGGVFDDVRPLAAKARSAQAATAVAAIAHQVFGAIGFTAEHELGRYTRRLWAWRDAWIRQADAEAEIGRRAAAAGGDGLWRLLVDRAPMRGPD